MKTIAILIPSLKTGGAEKQATILAMLLDKHYSIDVYLLSGIEQAASQNINLLSKTNICVHSLTGNIFFKIFQLMKYLRNKKPDILLNYLTSCDVIGAFVGRIVGIKRIYGGIRNTHLEKLKMVPEKIVHNYISSGTIYNCYSGAEYFATKGYEISKNIVIPNCFLDISAPIIRKDKEIKHIVTVGRFVPQKDYNTIVRTIARLKKIRRDFVMDIIGYGTEEQNIRDWIKEYKVEEYVNIYIRPENVQEIVKSADIYLSTSLFEGTSNSIMEALNWSLPIVATNVGDNSYLVLNGKNGMLHPIGDVEGMAKSIAKLLDSVKLRNDMGIMSNKNLHGNYSIDIFEKRYLNLINNIEGAGV